MLSPYPCEFCENSSVRDKERCETSFNICPSPPALRRSGMGAKLVIFIDMRIGAGVFLKMSDEKGVGMGDGWREDRERVAGSWLESTCF